MAKKQGSDNVTPVKKIAALVIAKNEATMLAGCLSCLGWCDEIVVLDNGSTDNTALIAEQFSARVIHFSHSSFARLREEVIKHTQAEWVLYIDADERVLPMLAREIAVHMEMGKEVALQFPRANIFFGKQFLHGGWGDEFVIRVFKRESLKGWKGAIHESPEFTGTLGELKTPLVHLTHRNTVSGLLKTASWTPLEAQAIYKANVKPVTIWTMLRKGFMEFLRRAILQRGYKDGTEGLIEAMIQAWNRMIVYVQVWELQQKPSLPERYTQIEQEIEAQWKSK